MLKAGWVGMGSGAGEMNEFLMKTPNPVYNKSLSVYTEPSPVQHFEVEVEEGELRENAVAARG